MPEQIAKATFRSLRGRNIRSEKVPQRGQFFDLLRRIVGLRNEKDRKNGPLWSFRSRHTFYRADSQPDSAVYCCRSDFQRSEFFPSSTPRSIVLNTVTASVDSNSFVVTQG